MSNKQGSITRREVMILGMSSAAFAGGTALVSLMGRRINRLQTRIDDIGLDKCDALIKACHHRWQFNERYKATPFEVGQWVATILTHDELLRDPLFYCSLIDLETLGDPTCYLPDDGKSNTRGLGCVSYRAAKDIVRIYKLPIKAIGTALWNPSFNIFCMIKCIEQSYGKCPGQIKDKLNWSLYCYNTGEGNAKRKLRQQGKLPTAYYKKHQRRSRLISDLM